jgi:hypothetical protein
VHDARKLANRFSNYWLENVYGWAPLFNDMNDGATAILDILEDPIALRTHVSGFSRQDYTKTLSGTSYLGGVLGSAFETRYSGQYLRALTYKFGCTVAASYRNQSALGNAAKALGLSWHNVVPSMWELIPYSFVVDYFTNTGDVLSALSAPTSGTSGGWSVQVDEGRLTTRESGTRTPSWFEGGYSGESVWSEESFNFSRQPWFVGERPSFEWKVPTVKSAANLVMLATSRLTKAKKLFEFL